MLRYIRGNKNIVVQRSLVLKITEGYVSKRYFVAKEEFHKQHGVGHRGRIGPSKIFIL